MKSKPKERWESMTGREKARKERSLLALRQKRKWLHAPELAHMERLPDRRKVEQPDSRGEQWRRGTKSVGCVFRVSLVSPPSQRQSALIGKAADGESHDANDEGPKRADAVHPSHVYQSV